MEAKEELEKSMQVTIKELQVQIDIASKLHEDAEEYKDAAEKDYIEAYDKFTDAKENHHIAEAMCKAYDAIYRDAESNYDPSEDESGVFYKRFSDAEDKYFDAKVTYEDAKTTLAKTGEDYNIAYKTYKDAEEKYCDAEEICENAYYDYNVALKNQEKDDHKMEKERNKNK